MCLNLPKHVARVFCLLWREATSYSDGGASTEDALWIPYGRVNLQKPHIEREMWNISSELSSLPEERMFPCCQIHKTVLLWNLWLISRTCSFLRPSRFPPILCIFTKILKARQVENYYCIIKIIWNWPLCSSRAGETEGHTDKCLFLYMLYQHPPFLPSCLPLIMPLQKLDSP